MKSIEEKLKIAVCEIKAATEYLKPNGDLCEISAARDTLIEVLKEIKKGGDANVTDEFPKPLNPLHKGGRDRGVDWNRIRSIAETSGHPLIETALLQLKARVDEIASEIDRHRRLSVQANDMLKKRLDNQAKPIMPEMLEACNGPAMGTSRPPKGAVPVEFDEKCNLCSGSGQIPTSKQGDSSVCPQCGGEGVIGIDMTEDNPLRPCPDCKSESPEAEPPRCTRHSLQKLSDCPIHGKTASKPDSPPESDEKCTCPKDIRGRRYAREDNCPIHSPEPDEKRTKWRENMGSLATNPVHGKKDQNQPSIVTFDEPPDRPSESDEPQPGDLCLFWGANPWSRDNPVIMEYGMRAEDGRHRARLGRVIGDWPNCERVQQNEIRELRIAKDALKNIRLCLLTTELSRKHLAGSLEKTLIGMGDKVTIERKEQDDE